MNLTIPHSLLVAPQKNWDGVMQIASRPIALIGTYLSSEDSKIQLLAIMIVRNSIQTILYPPTLYFPTMEDIETESLEKIHQIWKANHETLIGIIEKHEIPHFGFHGTPKAELEGICSSKSARYPGYLWVAGLACHLYRT